MSKATKKFWLFNKLSDAEGVLFLYGQLASETWWGDEVTPRLFADDLKTLGDVGTITVRINSPGGDVFAALAITGLLRDHTARIVAIVDGVCASAATIIMVNADEVQVSPGSMVLIHDPTSAVWGTAEDMEAMAAFLRKGKDGIVDAYQKRTGIDAETLSQMMSDETWMNGREAVDMKFADILIGDDSGGDSGFTAAARWSMAGLWNSLRNKAKATEPKTPDASNGVANRLQAQLELLKLI